MPAAKNDNLSLVPEPTLLQESTTLEAIEESPLLWSLWTPSSFSVEQKGKY